jgi:hypothetical protein
MPLVVTKLEQGILKAFKAAEKTPGPAGEAALAKFLAIAIDQYIKSGVVNVVVTTPVGPAPGVGAIL